MKEYTLITGATSGIGLAVARHLAPSCKLIVHGRDIEKLQIILDELDGSHIAFAYDLKNLNGLGKAFTDFMKDHGILVNKVIHCAGIDQTLPAKSLRASLIDEVMAINFYSVVELINVLLKKSVNNSSLKNIIFISSISSIRGFKAKAAYSASKAALDSYMRVLSKELAPRVVVNSILPGAVPTSMTAEVFSSPAMQEHFQKIYPLGIGSTKQLAEIIKYHHDVCDSWITGQQVIVDGGMTS